MPRGSRGRHAEGMDTRTRLRLGTAVAAALAALALAGLGLASVYGFAAEYGGGSFGQLAFLVVPIPLLAVLVCVVAWPRLRTAVRVSVVGVAAAVLVGGGLVADALGSGDHDGRILEESETFACNGPNSEVAVPAVVDRTWQELPRVAPVYGPIRGSADFCEAGVSGDGEQTFADYTDAFRELDGWRVRRDEPRRFEMTRDGVVVAVRLVGAPDRLTMIKVGVTG